MKLPNIYEIKQDAAHALRRARDPQKLILAFSGIQVLILTLVTLGSSWLSNEIAGTGGLSNFGIRSILSTAQSVLPIAQTILLLALQFGYFSGILRLSRGQYADHTDLKTGFHRLGAVLRLYIIQALRFFSLGIVVFYLSIQLFMLTPLADPLVSILQPLAESVETSSELLAKIDPVTLDLVYQALIPMYFVFAVMYCIVAIPMFYRMRLAPYILLDDPKCPARLAIYKSTLMLKGNKFRLFKLDLSYWWYYLLVSLAAVVSYGDVILAMCGIQLPFNDTIAFYLFYLLYLAALFAVYYFFRNPVEIAYAKAYDSLVEKPADNGVVLGNIFDL